MPADLANGVPIGAILPYAGPSSEGQRKQLNKAGWFICVHNDLTYASYRELYSSIYPYDPNPRVTTFELPDFAGMFLRGHDPNGVRDKDHETRQPPNGLLDHKSVGTRQGWGTADSTAGFSSVDLSTPGGPVQITEGTFDYKFRVYAPGFGTSSMPPDPSQETFPRNIVVMFLIKVFGDAVVPVGSIIQLGVDPADLALSDTYQPCHGGSLDKSAYPELGELLGDMYGKRDQGHFGLPDHRGHFFRGWDPAKTKAGTTHEFFTAVPTQGLSTTCPALTEAWAEKLPPPTRAGAPKHVDVCARGENRDIDLLGRGSDSETRPVNVCVDSYIVARPLKPEDSLPVGALVAYPGQPLDGKLIAPPGWRDCDGSVIDPGPKLHDILRQQGSVRSGSADVVLPDYSGCFLRNIDPEGKKDPDASRRTSVTGGLIGNKVGSHQASATAAGALSYWVTADFGDPGRIADASTPGWWGNVDAASAGTGVLKVSGFDKETRPNNKSVRFLIWTGSGL